MGEPSLTRLGCFGVRLQCGSVWLTLQTDGEKQSSCALQLRLIINIFYGLSLWHSYSSTVCVWKRNNVHKWRHITGKLSIEKYPSQSLHPRIAEGKIQVTSFCSPPRVLEIMKCKILCKNVLSNVLHISWVRDFHFQVKQKNKLERANEVFLELTSLNHCSSWWDLEKSRYSALAHKNTWVGIAGDQRALSSDVATVVWLCLTC